MIYQVGYKQSSPTQSKVKQQIPTSFLFVFDLHTCNKERDEYGIKIVHEDNDLINGCATGVTLSKIKHNMQGR